MCKVGIGVIETPDTLAVAEVLLCVHEGHVVMMISSVSVTTGVLMELIDETQSS